MQYCPFRHFRHPCIATQMTFVRLACLIHAANVRSEPGSNPSIIVILREAETPRFESGGLVTRTRSPVRDQPERLESLCSARLKEQDDDGKPSPSLWLRLAAKQY